MKYITIFIVVVLMSNWRRMCNSQTQLLRNKPKFFQRSASFFLQMFKYNQYTLCKCFQSMFLPNVLFRCFRFQAYSELLPWSGPFLLVATLWFPHNEDVKLPHVFYIFSWIQWRRWPKFLAGAGFTSTLNGANAKSILSSSYDNCGFARQLQQSCCCRFGHIET